MDTRQVRDQILGESGSAVVFHIQAPGSKRIEAVSLIRDPTGGTPKKAPPPANAYYDAAGGTPTKQAPSATPYYGAPPQQRLPSGGGAHATMPPTPHRPIPETPQGNRNSDDRVKEWLAGSYSRPGETSGNITTNPISSALQRDGLADGPTRDFGGASVALEKSREFASQILQLVEDQDAQYRQEVERSLSQLMATVNSVVQEFERERAQMRQDAQKSQELEAKVAELTAAVAQMSNNAKINHGPFIQGHQGSPLRNEPPIKENEPYVDDVVLREEAVM
eukprot:Tamp_02753.p1 GENE.Tamp_02753~~Tamp_02753.p1  ORF type:complete len:326 (+),score=51.89 Tamp_02753:142-978(+)